MREKAQSKQPSLPCGADDKALPRMNLLALRPALLNNPLSSFPLSEQP